eukprot:m.80019 g.80019  ORF g.80019 m.80019 type:complete len:1488 (-) comp14647_c0_seq3:1599-6062(-)
MAVAPTDPNSSGMELLNTRYHDNISPMPAEAFVETDDDSDAPFRDRTNTQRRRYQVGEFKESDHLGAFIPEVFHMHPRCLKYCEAKENTCACGRSKAHHQELARGTADDWSVEECTETKKTTCYGSVMFDNQQSAQFLRLSSTDQPQKAIHIVREFLRRRLLKDPGSTGYTDPSLIISVTGGAKTFDLPPRLLSMIRKGLQHAAESTDAWVVTGGTHSGVMKLVGEIMADVPSRKSPCIGIATWGIVKDRHLFSNQSSHEQTIPYRSHHYKALDENHNIFLLVDDGKYETFGGEIQFRASFEALVAEELKVPIVTIVIQGGPNTLQTAYDALQTGTPLVVVAGTGGAADLLTMAWEFLHGETYKSRHMSCADIRRAIMSTFPGRVSSNEELKKMHHMILECVQEKNKVIIYELEDAEGRNLSDFILKAMFHTQQVGSLKNKIKQAMLWKRLDIATDALTAFKSQHDSEEFQECLATNLLWALKNNSPEFVELFIEYGVKVWKLTPEQDLPPSPHKAQTAKKRRVLSDSHHNARVKTPFELAVQQLYEHYHTDKTLHVYYLLGAGDVDLDRVHQILQKLVGSEFDLSYDCSIFADGDDGPKEKLAFHMLMIWAVCVNKFRLCQLFWLKAGSPVSNALVASKMLAELSHHKNLNVVHLSDDKEKMTHNSKKFEDMAVGVLELCQKRNGNLIADMLHLPIPRFKDRNCIEIAHEADNINFISHPATMAVVSHDWFFGAPYAKRNKEFAIIYMEPNTAWYWVVLSILIPGSAILFIDFNQHQPMKFLQSDLNNESIISGLQRQEPLDMAESAPEIGLAEKYLAFYQAPQVRFWVDVLAYLALLLIFSFVALTPFEDRLSSLEWVLIVWFVSLLLEECRQAIDMYTTVGLKHYYHDSWNRLDMLILVVYFGSLFRRVEGLDKLSDQLDTKAMMAVASLLLWLRSLRYYAVSHQLGPKLLMMKRMIKDVVTFVCFLVVFLLSYGIASTILISPENKFDGRTVVNILYHPYFSIYGELFLDDINEQTDCVGSWPFSSCGATGAWLVPLLLAAYLLSVNILLVNLLIAMFNQTYAGVEEKSRKLWNMQNFDLYQEYRRRPAWPAPLIILSHIKRVIQFCVAAGQRDHRTRQEFQPEMISLLDKFQETSAETFYHHTKKQNTESDSSRIEANGKHIVIVENSIKKLADQVSLLRNMIERQHLLISVRGDDESSDEVDDLWRPPRKFPHKSAPLRAEVPLSRISWSIPYDDYKPPDFTSDHVIGAEWADPEDPRSLKFSEVDGVVNRVSYVCLERGTRLDIEPDSGRPLNPMGRTGLRGRGVLGKWGVNHAADPIFTRWKRNAQGGIIERNGKKVLEFVAIERRDGTGWGIPGGFVDNGQTVSQTLRSEFQEEALNSLHMDSEARLKADALVQELFATGRLIRECYSNDHRNTDNAWVETAAYNFHDDTGSGAGRFKLEGGDDAKGARWMMVHQDLQLFASHRSFLRDVARYHNAFW